MSCETFNVSQGEQRRVIMKVSCQRIRGLKAAEFEFEWFGTSKLLSDRKARLMRAKSCRLFLIVESDGEKRQTIITDGENVVVITGKKIMQFTRLVYREV